MVTFKTCDNNKIENFKQSEEVEWMNEDIITAMEILTDQLRNSIDEAQMRRVFHLIYDTLRCKVYL